MLDMIHVSRRVAAVDRSKRLRQSVLLPAGVYKACAEDCLYGPLETDKKTYWRPRFWEVPLTVFNVS